MVEMHRGGSKVLPLLLLPVLVSISLAFNVQAREAQGLRGGHPERQHAKADVGSPKQDLKQWSRGPAYFQQVMDFIGLGVAPKVSNGEISENEISVVTTRDADSKPLSWGWVEWYIRQDCREPDGIWAGVESALTTEEAMWRAQVSALVEYYINALNALEAERETRQRAEAEVQVWRNYYLQSSLQVPMAREARPKSTWGTAIMQGLADGLTAFAESGQRNRPRRFLLSTMGEPSRLVIIPDQSYYSLPSGTTLIRIDGKSFRLKSRD